jgi:O-methyltransferase
MFARRLTHCARLGLISRSKFFPIPRRMESMPHQKGFDSPIMSIINFNRFVRSRFADIRGRVSGHRTPPKKAGSPGQLYLDLMKRSLTNSIYGGEDEFLSDLEAREKGTGWPRSAHTMIGLKRLDNIQFCVEDVLASGVPGDLIETGVWRGGATIFMRAILKVHGDIRRKVFVADSFQGLPPPNELKYPQDTGDTLHSFQELAIPLERVRDNFARYGLLDEQVSFLKGWFRDTLPAAPIERLAVARLDGDMYESTLDALVNLYPKLSVGGYLIVDDYGCIHACRQAVEDFRRQQQIRDEIHQIDWTGVYWQRSA